MIIKTIYSQSKAYLAHLWKSWIIALVVPHTFKPIVLDVHCSLSIVYVDLSYSGIFRHRQLLSNIFLRLQNLCEIVFLIQPLYHQATEQRGWVGLWIYARLKGKMHNEVKWCVQRSQLTCHASQQKSWINSTMLVKITRGIKMWEVGWFDMSQTTPTTIEYEEHTYTTHIPAWWRF